MSKIRFFYLKNKESVNTYCVKHSKIENIQKKKYRSHNGLEETKYKVTVNCIKDQDIERFQIGLMNEISKPQEEVSLKEIMFLQV